MHRPTLFSVLVIAMTSVAAASVNEQLHRNRASSKSERGHNRNGKFMSLFSVVRFSNAGCNGTSSSTDVGVCLTGRECSSEGGTSIGRCAGGFGVCCQIIKSACGSVVTRNCTYIQNPNYPSSEAGGSTCSYTINKCSPDICYLKLDMEKNTIASQETESRTFLNSKATEKGLCLTDTMQTTCSTNTEFPSNFCGVNDGQHAYLGVRSQDSCTINFFLGSGSANERAWRIKISQIACDSILAPPAGCLQYFYGPTGTFCSYGYEDNIRHIHLNNQEYSYCIRMELGMCSITYTAAADKNYPFRISGPGNKANVDSCSTDYLLIPNGFGHSSASNKHSKFCGEMFGGSVDLAYNEAITTESKPFIVGFVSNNEEGTNNFDQNGFCLDYVQNPC